MRRTDLLARYGGEELAVVLRDCSHIAAVTILDDLRWATHRRLPGRRHWIRCAA
jgi:PleD family two-component response regulator